jgi:muramoyltetrapeptide carboxypeptidase
VLLVEEVGEKPYAIDRDLTQLAHAGVLRGARGAIVADLVRCTDAAWPDAALDTVGERLAAAGLSAWWGAPVGHGRRNRALPFGARVEVDEAGGFTILDAAVR